MTTLYVSSVDGNNADNGTTWALAKQTVAGALSALTGTGPHIIYVDSAHNFTGAGAVTWSPAVDKQKVAIISVDRNGSSTTGHNGWLAGATETSGSTSQMTISAGATQDCFFYISGCTIRTNTGGSAGDSLSIGTSATNENFILFDNCKLQSRGTSTSSAMIFGAAAAASAVLATKVVLRNCELTTKNAASNRGILIRAAEVTMIKCTHAYTDAASKSPTLFGFTTTPANGFLICQDCDLSGFNDGNYFDVSAMSNAKAWMVNCKLSATPGIVTGTWPANQSSITLVNTDDADTANVFEYRTQTGTLVVDTATYRNDGAKYDNAGVSWKIDTTADCAENTPFVTPWLHRFLASTGSRDFTLELLRDNATDYTNREVWAEFETLEDGSFPLGTLTSSQNSNPFDGTGVDLTNSSNNSWTESLTNDNEMLITATRTTAEKSMIRARLNIAVASTTLYFDPQISISGQPNNCPTRWTVEGAVNSEPVAPKANYLAGL